MLTSCNSPAGNQGAAYSVGKNFPQFLSQHREIWIKNEKEHKGAVGCEKLGRGNTFLHVEF